MPRIGLCAGNIQMQSPQVLGVQWIDRCVKNRPETRTVWWRLLGKSAGRILRARVKEQRQLEWGRYGVSKNFPEKIAFKLRFKEEWPFSRYLGWGASFPENGQRYEDRREPEGKGDVIRSFWLEGGKKRGGRWARPLHHLGERRRSYREMAVGGREQRPSIWEGQ